MRGKGVQMDFITLDQTIDGIARRIKFPEGYSRYADLGIVYKTSEAAANLHQRLHTALLRQSFAGLNAPVLSP